MRTGNTLSIAPSTMPLPTERPAFSPPQRSPWHSPLPYLFGGLAAMMGLIAFALLILACSYWRLSSRRLQENNGQDGGGRSDIESGHDKAAAKALPVFDERILVIMAGDSKPTFLATPISSSASNSCGDSESRNEDGEKGESMANDEKPKQENPESQPQHN
ncbi:protein GLUTAMINE DUMPER 5-like [Diospyros lotus]|uniref:protein GLUTAMINE DUMPER 5-like n=1 Tax=Diospyros lotus TaxID=55363 RepID=UPI0022537BF9|nr:protein GLUTAMINE DUMPER 5-like [Diospyros lotus]